MTYTKTIIISCLIFCFNYSAFAYSPPAGYSEEFNTNISIALSKNGVRGCGYLVWKNLVQNDSKYLIFCSRDGKDKGSSLRLTHEQSIFSYFNIFYLYS